MIGHYIRRNVVWHLIESEITDRYVTRCGRKLRKGAIASKDKIEGQPVCFYCGQRRSF